MKKNYFLIAALLAFVFVFISTVKADEQQSEKKTKTVTVYYCDPGPGDCLSFQNNGGNPMWVVIPGILKVTTAEVPALYSPPASGYTEYPHYFCHDPNNNSIGTGVINGYLHYKDPSSTFLGYKCEESTIYTNYNDWKSHLP